ncbi:unnamed protein product [Gadus morhua 'NCC']
MWLRSCCRLAGVETRGVVGPGAPVTVLPRAQRKDRRRESKAERTNIIRQEIRLSPRATGWTSTESGRRSSASCPRLDSGLWNPLEIWAVFSRGNPGSETFPVWEAGVRTMVWASPARCGGRVAGPSTLVLGLCSGSVHPAVRAMDPNGPLMTLISIRPGSWCLHGLAHQQHTRSRHLTHNIPTPLHRARRPEDDLGGGGLIRAPQRHIVPAERPAARGIVI